MDTQYFMIDQNMFVGFLRYNICMAILHIYICVLLLFTRGLRLSVTRIYENVLLFEQKTQISFISLFGYNYLF